MHHLPYVAGLIAITTPLAAQAAAHRADPAATKAAETITKEDVARRINIIADDSMMGRDTPSPGLEKTAQYVADQLKQFGLKPGGDHGTWFQRYPLPGDTSVTAPNTVGILEGSDPKLKNEYIVFSAHMDHIGVGENGHAMSPPTATDSIYNGADDNASGTAGILELAQAFVQAGVRPKRSMIFVGVSGEEQGLWGSEYFTEHLPVPLKQVVADFNIDGIGRNLKDSIIVIGQEFSDLGTTLSRVAAAHPELRMVPIPDRSPEEHFYQRSDQYHFARRGIPILFFMGMGAGKDYHAVTDSPDKVDADKATRILRLVFYAAHAVDRADQRPQWDPASYKEVVEQP